MKTTTPELTNLDLSLIVIDPELQPRELMDHARITQYAEDMLVGIVFPPLRVFRVSDRDNRYYLTSGFHRFDAGQEAGLEAMAAEVVDGTFAEAMWDAAGSNLEWDKSTEGIRRRHADKQRSVRMALQAMPGKSDRAIAEKVGVDHKTVSKHRNSLTGEIPQSTSRTGLDGINRGEKFIPEKAKPYWAEANGVKFPGETPAPLSVPDEPLFSLEILPSFIATEVKPATRSTFNQTNDMVDWARWTWNPVTGCEHNCVYCYARDIANRFYPEKFEPTYRPERLDAPRNTKVPGTVAFATDPVEKTSWRNVFVCSMADLFGRWVPDEWINGVFESCRQSPQWNYLFLTKFPQRYVGLDFPETSWVGTSIDEQKRVANAEKAFRKIKVPVRWLSVEPMREPIKFNDLSMFDWVVIGGQSRSSGAPEMFPDPDWVVDLIHCARQAGCKVYCKPNTDPARHWAGIYKQYPSAFEANP